MLNSIERPFVFIREPILFLIYFFYLTDYGISKRWAIPYAIFAFFISSIALAQAIYWQLPALIPIMGIRYYTFYIPLAFIMAEVVTREQMARILRSLFLISIPVGILVLLQFSWPVEHEINKGVADDIGQRFTVVADIIRPSGPFTSASAQAHFSAMMLAILAIAIHKRKFYEISISLILVSGFFILTMGALSGGRTYFGFAILVVLSYIVSGLTAPRIASAINRLFMAALFVSAFMFTFVFLFPRAFDAMTERQATAVSHEGSTLSRVIDGFTDVLEPLSHAPIFGYGLGAGSNAARMAWNTDNGFIFGETEWTRMINEIGPVFGFSVLGIRIVLVIFIGIMAIRTNRRTGDGSAVILFGFTGYLLLTGQITMQNQLVSFCWFSVGMILAFMRLSRSDRT